MKRKRKIAIIILALLLAIGIITLYVPLLFPRVNYYELEDISPKNESSSDSSSSFDVDFSSNSSTPNLTQNER